nr:hypothetical protein Itr_chr12CG08190 [Ipomoea trifida]
MGNWVISLTPTQFYPKRTAPSSSSPLALTPPSSQDLPHKSFLKTSHTNLLIPTQTKVHNVNSSEAMTGSSVAGNTPAACYSTPAKKIGVILGFVVETLHFNKKNERRNGSEIHKIDLGYCSSNAAPPSVSASNTAAMVELPLVSMKVSTVLHGGSIMEDSNDSFETSSGVFPFVK